MRFSGSIRVFAVILATLALTGCFKEWSMEEVQEWYEEQPETFEDYMRLGKTKESEGKTAKAIRMYQGAADFVEGSYGPQDLRIATALDELAHLEEKRGFNGKAADSYKRALEVRNSTLPRMHADVRRNKRELAKVLKKLYKTEEAKKLLREAAGKFDDEKKVEKKDKKKPEKRTRRRKRKIRHH